MPIQQKFKAKDKASMVWFRSGHIYSFRYKNFENDPNPTILCLYALKGINPNTGHMWNLVQGINLNYIARNNRRTFLHTWLPLLERNRGNIRLTWEMILRRFPYLTAACRRYLLDRKMFADLKELELDDIESIVVSTWAKDYSRQVQRTLLKKYKKANKYLRSIITSSFTGLRPPGPYYRNDTGRQFGKGSKENL